MEMGLGGGSELQMAEERVRPCGNPQVGVSMHGTKGKRAEPVSISIIVLLRIPNVPRPLIMEINAWAMLTVVLGWTPTCSHLPPPLFP